MLQSNERKLRRGWVDSRRSRDRRRLEQAVMRSGFDRLLDTYVGDVVNFITSMSRLPCARGDIRLSRVFGGTVPTDPLTSLLPGDLVRAFVESSRRERDVMLLADNVRARFERAAWVATIQDECTDIQVLAHSLGTLVAYHAMNRPLTGGSGACSAQLTRFHTIGSPLEKIHFFWPQLVAPRTGHPTLLGQGPDDHSVSIAAHPDFEWRNYYSVSDKVSGALTRFKGWSGISNERLAGLGGVLSAHVAYKKHARFVAMLAEQLGVRSAPPREGGWRLTWAWIWSAWQALLLPLMAGAVCLLGLGFLAAFSIFIAGLLTAVISTVGYIVNWVLTGTGERVWFGRFFFWVAAFFFASITASVTVIPATWARRAARASVAHWWRTVQPS